MGTVLPPKPWGKDFYVPFPPPLFSVQFFDVGREGGKGLIEKSSPWLYEK
jgi:hypothetical protein